ncbi:Preprotein translocase subunit [Nymphaea thermarum]|nr:Preprotein translocase subunit [Nymphaea thermarum]
MLAVLEESVAKSPVCACLKNGRALIDYFASNTTEASPLISATPALWSTASIGRTLFSSGCRVVDLRNCMAICSLGYLLPDMAHGLEGKGGCGRLGKGREGRLGKREEERKEGSATGETLASVLKEIHMIEWLDFGKVLGTTGVVLSVIAGSSVVLLTVNAIFVDLSNRVFAGKGVQDFLPPPSLPPPHSLPFPSSSFFSSFFFLLLSLFHLVLGRLVKNFCVSCCGRSGLSVNLQKQFTFTIDSLNNRLTAKA